MQFDLQRAFPYPVLRPHNDDYIDGEFQTSISLEVDQESLSLSAKVNCALSVTELADLISERKACYVVMFSCRDTFLRHIEKQFQKDFEVKFLPGDLKGAVEIYPFVASIEKVNDFSSELINSEWGIGPFFFDTGSVLAIDEPQQIYIDRDLFKPITSVFVLVKNDNIADDEWHVNLDDDKVKIGISTATKEIIDRVRNSDQNRAVLINSIYFGAVMQCVSQLKSSEDYDEHRWAIVMRQQAEQEKINIKTEDEYIVAQKLMRQPLKLLSTYVFRDDKS